MGCDLDADHSWPLRVRATTWPFVIIDGLGKAGRFGMIVRADRAPCDTIGQWIWRCIAALAAIRRACISARPLAPDTGKRLDRRADINGVAAEPIEFGYDENVAGFQAVRQL